MKNILIFTIVITIFFNAVCFSFANAEYMPKSPEELKTGIWQIIKGVPSVIKNSFFEAVRVCGGWLKGVWDSYIAPWVNTIINKVKSFIFSEVEKKKPEAEKEFERKKQELKEEVPKATKSLWERFKELIK